MIITTTWKGSGTEAKPFEPVIPTEHVGKAWAVVSKGTPKAGDSVKVEVKKL